MCEVHAHCPNCGQPELDADELKCFTANGETVRAYLCSRCGALVTVVLGASGRANLP